MTVICAVQLSQRCHDLLRVLQRLCWMRVQAQRGQFHQHTCQQLQSLARMMLNERRVQRLQLLLRGIDIELTAKSDALSIRLPLRCLAAIRTTESC